MNIFRFELRSLFRPFFTWTVSLIGTMMLFVWGIFPLFMESKNELEAVMQNFPPQFAQMFGIMGDLFSFEGFYRFSYLYISVMGAIFALQMAVSAFYREKRTGSLEFLLTKPVSRSEIFFAKLGAVTTWVVLSSLLYGLAFIWMARLRQVGQPIDRPLLLAGFAILGLELVFVGIGTFLAVYMRKIRSVAGVATIGGMVAFIVSSLYNLLELPELRWISALQYFDVGYAFRHGVYEWEYVGAAVGLTAVTLGLAYVKYVRQDAKQV